MDAQRNNLPGYREAQKNPLWSRIGSIEYDILFRRKGFTFVSFFGIKISANKSVAMKGYHLVCLDTSE